MHDRQPEPPPVAQPSSHAPSGNPYEQNPYAAPPGAPQGNPYDRPYYPPHHPHHPPQNQGIQTLIPTKNPPALFGYYCSVFSLIPCLGLPLSIVAIILGGVGLSAIGRTPGLPGKAHAWVAICLGSFTLIANFVGIMLIFVGRNSGG